jgi:hypothetical protein
MIIYDDLGYFGTDAKMLDDLEETLASRFKIKTNEESKSFVGLQHKPNT